MCLRQRLVLLRLALELRLLLLQRDLQLGLAEHRGLVGRVVVVLVLVATVAVPLALLALVLLGAALLLDLALVVLLQLVQAPLGKLFRPRISNWHSMHTEIVSGTLQRAM